MSKYYETKIENFKLRKAEERDAGLILNFIKKIATYESSGTFKNDKLKMVYYKNKKRTSKSTYNKATRKYNNWDHLE